MKYKVTLTTVASINVTVDADDEDAALDKAYESAREFANQYHAGYDWHVEINETWELREPTIEPQD